MKALSQVRAVVVGLIAVTAACSGKTTGEADGPASDARAEQGGSSRDDGSPGYEQVDGDGSWAAIDSDSTACFAGPALQKNCPQDWDAAGQGHCHLERQPSADCGYLRVPDQGVDGWTLCLYDSKSLQLVGSRFYSANADTFGCWGMKSGFADPGGCEYVADLCPPDASESEVGH